MAARRRKSDQAATKVRTQRRALVGARPRSSGVSQGQLTRSFNRGANHDRNP
jgi:hypothetical protein